MNILVKYMTIAALIAALDVPWLLVSNTFVSSMIQKIQGKEINL